MLVRDILYTYVGSQRIELYEKKLVTGLFGKEKLKAVQKDEMELTQVSDLKKYPDYLVKNCKIKMWTSSSWITYILIFIE